MTVGSIPSALYSVFWRRPKSTGRWASMGVLLSCWCRDLWESRLPFSFPSIYLLIRDVCTHTMAHMWRSEGSFQRQSSPSIHHVGSGH